MRRVIGRFCLCRDFYPDGRTVLTAVTAAIVAVAVRVVGSTTADYAAAELVAHCNCVVKAERDFHLQVEKIAFRAAAFAETSSVVLHSGCLANDFAARSGFPFATDFPFAVVAFRAIAGTCFRNCSADYDEENSHCRLPPVAKFRLVVKHFYFASSFDFVAANCFDLAGEFASARQSWAKGLYAADCRLQLATHCDRNADG